MKNLKMLMCVILAGALSANASAGSTTVNGSKATALIEAGQADTIINKVNRRPSRASSFLFRVPRLLSAIARQLSKCLTVVRGTPCLTRIAAQPPAKSGSPGERDRMWPAGPPASFLA